ncbi:unnamed protein product, partial [Protopolystoma xenopodis]
MDCGADFDLYHVSGNSSSIARSSSFRIELPVIDQSAFKLHLPPEIYLKITENSILNTTIFIILPSLSFPVSNSSFIFKGPSDHVTRGIFISQTGAVIINEIIDIDGLASISSHPKDYATVILPFTVADQNNFLVSSIAESRLVVDILDINDNDPIVVNNNSRFDIPEDTPIGQIIFKVDAFDPDLSATQLTFDLLGAEKLPFEFDPKFKDSLRISRQLDAETMPPVFILFVKVSDFGFPLPRSTIATFSIQLVDVNEFAPQFVEESCEAWLVQTSKYVEDAESAMGFNLGRYSAEDADRD